MIRFAVLAERGVVAVNGPDARGFLDNILTNDLDRLTRTGDAQHAALLSPQGKILFAVFVVATREGFLLETGGAEAPAMTKRLALYKLRAKVEIADVSASHDVLVSAEPPGAALPAGAIAFADPRHAGLGWRVLAPKGAIAATGSAADYDAARVANGVPEAGRDYAPGDAFPHEANMDLLNGVSFSKGCFVGQEVVARMQHKAVIRKRVVCVEGAAALTVGAEVRVGEAVIGRVGSVNGTAGLAMLRIDRAAEAVDKGLPIVAGDAPVTVDARALAAYREAAAARSGQ